MVKAIIKASTGDVPLRDLAGISWEGYMIEPDFWQAKVPFFGYVEVGGAPICKAVVFDLSGPQLPGVRIAGWGGGFTVERYRHRGLWSHLMQAFDTWADTSPFDCIAARTLPGLGQAFKTLCPGFFFIKEKDQWDNDWLLRILTVADVTVVLEYLEREIKKW